MKKLYVLGNGFDIYHGLKTRYTDFHRYVSQNNPDLENTLDNYFEFKTDRNYLWNDFENDLSHFDHESFFDSYNHIDVVSESFRPSECFGLEDELNQEAEDLIQSIREEFLAWIENIEYPESVKNTLKAISFEQNAIFLNFNYTDTLEEFYGIAKSRILYIHNNANDFSGDLIFGHPQRKEAKPQIKEFDADGESNRTMFTDAENVSRVPFYAFQKDTKEVIKQHQQFFNTLDSIDEVIVLGHSLGKVDWPYFRLIFKKANNANWKISYYDKSEMDSKRAFAAKMLGKGTFNIEMIQISDLTVN